MKRSLLNLSLVLLAALMSCREQKTIDPTVRVRPVSLQVRVIGSQYELSWQEVRIVCVTAPCPDVADVEAEEYEVQVANGELGTFLPYTTLTPDKKLISVPVSQVGGQIILRVLSKHTGAPSASSNLVMTSAAPMAQSASFAGYGTATDVFGGGITSNGNRSVYLGFVQEASGEYSFPLYVSDLMNDRVVNTKLITRSGSGAALSPDGKQIAYPSRTAKSLMIYDIAAETTRALPITDTTWVWSLDWSPDGKWLAYSTVSNEESRLWKIATSGGQAIVLTPILPFRESNYIRQSAIQWTPDGRFIALSRARGNDPTGNWRSVISLYSPDGGGETSYFDTQPGWIDTNPAFSPDGKTLAFQSSRTDPLGGYSLWIRDLATKELRQIRLPNGQQLSYDYAPHWIGNDRLVYLAIAQGRKNYFSVTL